MDPCEIAERYLDSTGENRRPTAHAEYDITSEIVITSEARNLLLSAPGTTDGEKSRSLTA
jgi:hypothetical protein